MASRLVLVWEEVANNPKDCAKYRAPLHQALDIADE